MPNNTQLIKRAFYFSEWTWMAEDPVSGIVTRLGWLKSLGQWKSLDSWLAASTALCEPCNNLSEMHHWSCLIA